MSSVRTGDLAVIVCPFSDPDVGRFVSVGRQLVPGDSMCGASLILDGRLGFWVSGNGLHYDGEPGFSEIPVFAEYLKPIRDPGDNAKDESLSWLPPVPNSITPEDAELLREAFKQWVKEQR